MGYVGQGEWVMQGWAGLCRGRGGLVMEGWGEWVMQGWVGHVGVGG